MITISVNRVNPVTGELEKVAGNFPAVQAMTEQKFQQALQDGTLADGMIVGTYDETGNEFEVKDISDTVDANSGVSYDVIKYGKVITVYLKKIGAVTGTYYLQGLPKPVKAIDIPLFFWDTNTTEKQGIVGVLSFSTNGSIQAGYITDLTSTHVCYTNFTYITSE